MEEEGAGVEVEVVEATTHAISLNRATAPEAATAVSPTREEEVEVPLLVDTINQVSTESEQCVRYEVFLQCRCHVLNPSQGLSSHTTQVEEEVVAGATKGVMVDEEGEGSRVDVEVDSKVEEEEGDGVGSNKALSLSSNTWARFPPFFSCCRAVRTHSSLYVHSFSLPQQLIALR